MLQLEINGEILYFNYHDKEERKAYNRLYQQQYRVKNKEKLEAYYKEWNAKQRQKEGWIERQREYLKNARLNMTEEQKDHIRQVARDRRRHRYNTEPEYKEETKKKNRERYNTDPEFRARQLERYKKRYANDEEFRRRQHEYSKQYALNRKIDNAEKNNGQVGNCSSNVFIMPF